MFILEEVFNIISVLTLIKVTFLVVNGIYVGFLLVVYKQSRAMQAVVNDNGASSLLNTVALFNIIVGVLLFVTALIIL